MNTVQANLINGISLILLGLWGYLDVDSPTALIPVFFGIILLLCHRGIKKENKTIAHIAVIFTLILLVSLAVVRLPKSLDSGGIGLYRVIFMVMTSAIAMIQFVRSFINARKSK